MHCACVHVQAFDTLEAQLSFDAGTSQAFRRLVFEAVNCQIMSVYVSRRRLHIDYEVLWRPAPMQKRLPDSAALRADVDYVGDSLRFTWDPRFSEPLQGEPAQVTQYRRHMNGARNEHWARTHANVMQHHSAHTTVEETMLLMAVADQILEEELETIAMSLLDIDSRSRRSCLACLLLKPLEAAQALGKLMFRGCNWMRSRLMSRGEVSQSE